jgi:hypothetical protein
MGKTETGNVFAGMQNIKNGGNTMSVAFSVQHIADVSTSLADAEKNKQTGHVFEI